MAPFRIRASRLGLGPAAWNRFQCPSFTNTARKRFGQNFLHDAGVIHRILRAIHAREGQRLLEIGPGQGALTEDCWAAAHAWT